jgi:acyl-coenzyme A synthetase/AMP-(fatty) acid ligase
MTVAAPTPFHTEAPSGQTVAFGRFAERSDYDLRDHTAELCLALERIGGRRFLVYTEDSYAAAVCLLAMAQTGSVAVLAPNRQPETLRRLGADVSAALIDPEIDIEELRSVEAFGPLSFGHQGAGSVAIGSKAFGRQSAPDWQWRAIDRDAPLVEFRTSGTTGDDKAVVKRWRHLVDEVATLEALFGDRLTQRTRVFGTVSHQHIYGLLFRVLWPLYSGRAFQTDLLLHSREILPQMSAAGDALLVSSPVHLKRMEATGELKSVATVCRAVFSSGGPLDAQTADGIAATLGESPCEILGSTETGGVAMRQRSRDGDGWHPLPRVEVERDTSGGRLIIKSPFSSEGEAVEPGLRRFRMGDRIELRPEGGFLLMGRGDRIVKVGEKRLSLPAMEADLAKHPRILEAALLVLDRGGQSRVHAVVSLDEHGRTLLREAGRRGLSAELSDHLALRWDRVLLPRVWRYVQELPRDAQGKLPLTRLEALFVPDRRDPDVIREVKSTHRITRHISVPDNLAYLPGHFDEFPVVAGVVQLRWVMDAATELLGERPGTTGLEALKFPEPLLPGQILDLEVEFTAPGGPIRFRLFDGERTFSTGRWRLGADD